MVKLHYKLLGTVARIGICGFIVFSLIGCGNSGPQRPTLYKATGKVLFQGRPAGNLILNLYLVNGNDYVENGGTYYRPQGKTNLQGEYSLSTFANGDGAPEGEYLVSIDSVGPIDKEFDSEKPLVDYLWGRYRNPRNSPFKIIIKPGNNEVQTINIK